MPPLGGQSSGLSFSSLRYSTRLVLVGSRSLEGFSSSTVSEGILKLFEKGRLSC
jgi:hypothetical protein